MNEQIEKLFDQALAEFAAENKYATVVVPDSLQRNFVEKFAELIVRECMKVAVNKDSGYIHPANIAGYMAAGRSTAAQMIKEHFGVEE